MMRADETGYVYFMRPVGQLGPIKIGCSRWPADRLKSYMSWSPITLEIVAIMPGDQALERRFHARFYGQQSHHEWFHPSAALERVIEEVAAGKFDASTLPAGRNLHRDGPAGAVETSKWLSAIGRLRWMEKRREPIPADILAAANIPLNADGVEKAERRARVIAFVDGCASEAAA